jgi:hypothetical protein
VVTHIGPAIIFETSSMNSFENSTRQEATKVGGWGDKTGSETLVGCMSENIVQNMKCRTVAKNREDLHYGRRYPQAANPTRTAGKRKRVDSLEKATKTCSEENLGALPLGRNTNDQQHLLRARAGGV